MRYFLTSEICEINKINEQTMLVTTTERDGSSGV